MPAQQPQRQISLRVSEKVYGRLEALAKEAGMQTGTLANLLFDAAYAARVKGTPDADLEAHVALVGMATQGGVSLEQIATGTGLTIATVTRMQDAWKDVLLERRRGQ